MEPNAEIAIETPVEPGVARVVPAGRRGPPPRAFSALRHRNFRLFWLGQLVSLSGSWLQVAAMQWLIYRLTGSAFALGWVSFLATLPIVPVSLVGGAIVDRVPKRKLIVGTQVGLMIQALLLALLTFTGLIEVWHIVVLQFMFGVLSAIDMPARQAFVVELVGKDDLQNAIALNSAIFNGARAVGPAIAGVLIATLGEAGAFAVNGFSYIAVIAGLLMMRIQDVAAEREKASLGSKMMEGFRYLLHQQVLVALITLMACIGFFGMTHITLMPVFARDVLGVGAGYYGLLLAAIGIGAVAGALAVATLRPGRRSIWLFAGTMGLAVSLVAFALSSQFVVAFAALIAAGAGFISTQALINTLVQVTVEDRLRGRVMSIYSLMFVGSQQVGALAAGAGAQLVGAQVTVAAGAIVTAVFAIGLFALVPAVRRLN